MRVSGRANIGGSKFVVVSAVKDYRTRDRSLSNLFAKKKGAGHGLSLAEHVLQPPLALLKFMALLVERRTHLTVACV